MAPTGLHISVEARLKIPRCARNVEAAAAIRVQVRGLPKEIRYRGALSPYV
jgi:hypothetical protein